MLMQVYHERLLVGARVLCRVAAGVSMLVAVGCLPSDGYSPPDLFYLYSNYAVGENPTSIATADFNGDGSTDLITTNISSNTLSILFGNGDGSFQKQESIRTCQEPRNLAINEFSGDPQDDLAVACSGSDQIAILFGQPDGSFTPGQAYDVHQTPVSIASEDYNGDGRPDLAVALRNDKIKLFFSQGRGGFVEGPQYEYGDTPTSIATGDLNRDGAYDLVVANGGPMSSAVSIWLGKGNGTFEEPVDYRTGKRPLSVSLADFNNDQVLDLFVINGEMNTFTVFLGNGDGTFQDAQDSGANARPVNGIARDFDGDSLADVGIVNIQSSDLSILYGRGDGTFHYPPINYKTPHGPFAITSLTIVAQEAGEPGLAIANNASNNVSVFLHRGLKALSTSKREDPRS